MAATFVSLFSIFALCILLIGLTVLAYQILQQDTKVKVPVKTQSHSNKIHRL